MKKIALFLALLVLFLLPVTVQAAQCSITVQAEPELAGAEFQLYRLDAVFESPDDAYAHVLQEEQTPVAEGILDGQGRLTFSALAEGYYLLKGHTLEITQDRFCRFDMSLLALPGAEGAYALVVEPKYEIEDIPGTVTYRALKLWEDDKPQERPGSIQVELYRNDELQDTVTLSKENRWQYQWQDSDPSADWAVAELTPACYRAEYERSGNTFVVHNTSRTVVEPTEPTETISPTAPSDPTGPSEPTAPSESTEPSQPTEPTAPTEPDKPGLPQTGQLWWPVPVMAFAGVLLFLLGWLRRKESRYEE